MAMGTLASAGRPRRVLIVVQNLPVPFDRRVWLEATTLAKAGYKVSVICPKAKGFNRSFEVLEDVHIHRYALPVDARGPFGFVVEFLWCFVRTTVKSVRVAVAGRGFDVLHVCNPPETYWPLGRFWKLFGKRFLFSQAISIRASDQDRASSQAQRFHDVASSPDPAIEQDLDLPANSRHDFRQHANRRLDLIELAASMVRDDDGVGPIVDRLPRIVFRVDALDDDRSLPRVPDRPRIVGRRSDVVHEGRLRRR